MSTITAPQTRLSRVALRDPSPDAGWRRGDAIPRRKPNLEVVPAAGRSARARRISRRAMIATGILAALATPFSLVLVHVELTTNQLRLTSLQTHADQAQRDYEKLRLQVAQLESPARIVATAQQLGMVTPTTIHYLTASPGSGATPAVTAAPQTNVNVESWATAKRVDTGR